MNSGVLLLNKPTGPSSARALYPVKRAVHGRKVGHTGTLDPFASGLLVVLVGNATRLSRWFTKLDKRYRAVVRFGTQTNTLDEEGEIVARAAPPERAAIEGVLPRFIGEIMQVPPAFSALKIGGRRAYELARSGTAVEPEAREVRVDEVTLGREIERGEETIDYALDVRCGSGTYLRSLARDIGIAAGSCASLVALERTMVGPFTLAEAQGTTDIERRNEVTMVGIVEAAERLGFAELRRVPDDTIRSRMRNGGHLTAEELRRIDIELGQRYLFVDRQGGEIAVGVLEERGLRYDAVFPQLETQ